MTARPGTVILGAGFGGVSTATALRGLAPDEDVTLVDAGDGFRMGLAALRALDGRDPGPLRPFAALARRGIRVVKASVQGIDASQRVVATSQGPLRYARLVVALGADLAPARVPGLPPQARNVYTVEGAALLRRDAAAVRSGGRILVVAPTMPWKCPPAPYEAASLLRAGLRRRGVDAEVVLATSEPHPLPVFPPEVGARLRSVVEARGVTVRNGSTLSGFEGTHAVFADGSRVGFDALGLVPPHVPPAAIAGLAGPSGWIEVDAGTLATTHPDVWAVGDCTMLKLAGGKALPKAGVLAEGEGLVVAANLAATLRGERPVARFDGKGTCFVELGDGTAMEGQGEFFATPPRMTSGEPTEAALAAKAAWERAHLDAWFGPE